MSKLVQQEELGVPISVGWWTPNKLTENMVVQCLQQYLHSLIELRYRLRQTQKALI
jgi:hypothetical protein